MDTTRSPFKIERAGEAISFVSGASGVEAGGARVNISGSNLAGTTSVTFGGVAALSFTATSGNITAYAPAGSGTVPIVVTNSLGSATATTQFTYTSATAPSILGLSNSAPPASGGKVAVFGSNLASATGVTVGGASVQFNVGLIATTGSDRLEVVVPPGTANAPTTLVVTTPSGSASTTLTYFPTPSGAPAISSVTPQTVSTAGGVSVQINGSNLSTATAVSFGGVAAPWFYQQGSNALFAMVPAGAAGAVDVSVTTPVGTATAQGGLTYVAAPVPVITSVSPSIGPVAGGTTIVIRGTGLTGATAVAIGGPNAPSFTVDSDTQITAVTPANSSGGGATGVTVTTPGGRSTSAPFTYAVAGFPAPTVSAIATSSGPTAGGTSVVITGTNFIAGTSVTFGGIAARIAINSSTQITATTPAGSAGTVDLGVTSPGGATTLSNAFTYSGQQQQQQAAPTISGVAPATGATAGGTSVVITGTDFTGATAVSFGSTAASSFTVDSATQITAVLRAASHS